MQQKESKFNNGDSLKDKVTGAKGIVMSITFYATGCIHYGLQPQKMKDDGTILDWVFFDQSRLETVETDVIAFDVDEEKPSGIEQNPPQR